jgi:hypothetical protein
MSPARCWYHADVSQYRDERDALRARLEQLERDLIELREDQDREAIKAQLAALSAQVAEATAQVEGDRAALGEVAESIQKLRASLGGPAETGKATPDATEPAKEPAHELAKSIEAVPGLGLRAWMVALALFVVVAALVVRSRTPAKPPDPLAAVAGIPGAPHAVDPIALLPTAKQRAVVRQFLVSIEGRYVGSNGRVDLRAPSYAGLIKYTFGERPPEPPPDPSRPLGAPKASGGAMPRQSQVTIDIGGIHIDPILLGFSGAEVPEPRCSFEAVWKGAIEAGAPGDAVAIIVYKLDTFAGLGLPGAARGPRAMWSFRIEGTAVDLKIEDSSCKVMGKGEAAP